MRAGDVEVTIHPPIPSNTRSPDEIAFAVRHDIVGGLSAAPHARSVTDEEAVDRFTVGVQWHPETNWRNDRFSEALFSAFVESAIIGRSR